MAVLGSLVRFILDLEVPKECENEFVRLCLAMESLYTSQALVAMLLFICITIGRAIIEEI